MLSILEKFVIGPRMVLCYCISKIKSIDSFIWYFFSSPVEKESLDAWGATTNWYIAEISAHQFVKLKFEFKITNNTNSFTKIKQNFSELFECTKCKRKGERVFLSRYMIKWKHHCF